MSLSWTKIQTLYDEDAAKFWGQAQAVGLQCPFDVFEQLFWEPYDLAAVEHYRTIDWNEVVWREVFLNGIALRQTSVNREFQYAVDEARRRTQENGVVDDRDEVIKSWSEDKTWIRAPVILSGDVTGSGLRYELIVGFTRVGNLLGLLDGQEITELAKHRVWLGTSD